MKKIIVIIMLIFLLSSPAISSLKITKEKSVPFEQNNLEKNNVDPKIQEIIDKINETLVRDYLEYLVYDIGSRYTGTYGCEKAAKYIHKQFTNAELQTRYQEYSSWGNRWHPNFFKSQNVEGTLAGIDPEYDEEIIFNAHYDTVRNTVGANDDGSGTAAVLATAYVLSQFEFKRTIRFVAVSGEENGLIGSNAYARELYMQKTPVLVEFNADVIGYSKSAEAGKRMRISTTEDATWIADVMDDMTKDYSFNFEIPRYTIDRSRTGGSDYASFANLGFEAIAIWAGEWGAEGHSPKDNMSNVNISYLVNNTRHIAATIAILADMEIEQPRAYIANPMRGKVFYDDIPQKSNKRKIPIVIGETNIYAEVKPGAYPIDRVEFHYDNKVLFTDEEKPYEYILNKRSIRFHKIKIIAYDTMGNNASDEVKMLYFNPFKNI